MQKRQITIAFTDTEIEMLVDAMSYQLDALADRSMKPRGEYSKQLYDQKLPLLWRLNAYVPKSEQAEEGQND